MNRTNFTYKQKNRILLAGVVLFAFIAYTTAIRDTIRLYQDNQQLADKISKAENAPRDIAELRQSLERLNDKLNHYLIDTTKDLEHTLEVVSEFCHKNKLTVRELPQRKIAVEHDFTIVTSVLKIEGDYVHLLYLLHELEFSQRLGRLSSVSWKSYVEAKTKKTILYMTVYLQNTTANAKPKESDEKKP